MTPVALPTRDVERVLLRAGASLVIGCDEVGRGALAGPVTVGVVAVDERMPDPPPGLRDSKLLSEPRRIELAPLAQRWARAWAVGDASAAEIDDLGIVRCLALAACRAVEALIDVGGAIDGATVLLDGQHDWLSATLHDHAPTSVRVHTRAKADRDCVAVAAASVIAKVHRDTAMIGAHAGEPHYAWASNKGYGSAAHMTAIEQHGPSVLHRATWLKVRA